MNLAIFGRNFGKEFVESINELFMYLRDNEVGIYIESGFYNFLYKKLDKELRILGTFQSYSDFPEDVEALLSIGGDGTFLEAVSLVRERDIPIAGINTGRLGFLAHIAKDEISNALDKICRKEYEVESRAMLELVSNDKKFKGFPYSLNEATIQKKGASMVTVHTYVDGEYLTTYWSDGIIIATPTGSTAYSLSVGGPIVVPGSENFIISPISPHNLSVRPIIISDNTEIRVEIESRSKEFLVSLDHRAESFSNKEVLTIRKAPFRANMIKFKDTSFYATLRNKLMWGADKRN